MTNDRHVTVCKTLVLGAGYSGLAAAALLAHAGEEVVVLEAHDTLGGCASFFRSGPYTFDVGATTFSGVRPDQPVGRLFGHLGLQPDFLKLDPAMLIRLPDLDVVRDADPAQWIDRARELFPQGDQRAYWQHLYRLEHRIWDLIADRPYLPPSSASDWRRMMHPNNLSSVPLIHGLVTPMSWLMHRHGVDADPRFRALVDEQMLISTQSTSTVAPYLTGAMGLTYPSETYYPVGGMYAPALLLLRHITQHGGGVRFRRRVTSIVRRPASDVHPINGLGTRDAGRWTVECTNGERYHAENVISSIPIWNMQHITDADVSAYYGRLSRRFSESWAALTMYLVVPQPTELPAPYIQMHLDREIEGVHSKSLFVSVSHAEDEKKAPRGEATVTVSTHTRGMGNGEWGIGNGEWGMKKERVMKEMVEAIKRRLPELGIENAHHLEGGTPGTWEKYTLRYHGYVGGIPHSVKRPMLMMPKNVTPFRGLYQIGDSAFPGQGTPAVIMGAWNTVARMFAS